MTLYIAFAYVHQEWFSRIIKTARAWKLLIVNLGNYRLLYVYRRILQPHEPFSHRCRSGECITASRKCNNFVDCADRSDESDCIPEKIEVICNWEEFKCHDGKQCIPIELRCDKTNDCRDKSDEADCLGYNSTTNCHNNQFRCLGGKCIDLTAVCDETKDCDDGDDELHCHDNDAMKRICPSNMFGCVNGQCIPPQWVCDEFPDCIDGSDEHNCRKYPV